MRPRRLKVVTLAAVVLAISTMSACSDHPGDAAAVGSERISTSDLDNVATSLCSAQTSSPQQGQPQELPTRSARELALGLLIDSKLSFAYGDAVGLQPDQEQVDQAVASREQVVSTVKSAHERKVLRATLTDLAKSQLILAEVGRRELAKSGTANITSDAAIAAGTKLRNDWVDKHLDVSVDPRFGTFSDGTLHAGGGSLSVPVSTRSKDGVKQQPSSTWVSSLPASQTCS
jgi:hypothetical protein